MAKAAKKTKMISRQKKDKNFEITVKPVCFNAGTNYWAGCDICNFKDKCITTNN